MVFLREGTFSPGGANFKECEVMFLGDSQFRYLKDHIPDKIVGFVPGVRFLSGANVDSMTEECESLVSDHVKVCVIHVGTNDLTTQKNTTRELLAKFDDMVTVILHRSPECEIVVSSVIPRDVNHHNVRHTQMVTRSQKDTVNLNILEFNALLSDLCSENERLHFVCHEQFWSFEPLSGQKPLLALDGLHLSTEGVQILAKNLISQVKTFQSSFAFEEHCLDESEIPNKYYGLASDDDFPHLPSPQRKAGENCPFTSDHALSVSKADLLRTSPIAAMLLRVSQREKEEKNKQKSTQSKCKPRCRFFGKFRQPNITNRLSVSKVVASVPKPQKMPVNMYEVLEIEEVEKADVTESNEVISSCCNSSVSFSVRRKLSKFQTACGVHQERMFFIKRKGQLTLTYSKKKGKSIFQPMKNFSLRSDNITSTSSCDTLTSSSSCETLTSSPPSSDALTFSSSDALTSSSVTLTSFSSSSDTLTSSSSSSDALTSCTSLSDALTSSTSSSDALTSSTSSSDALTSSSSVTLTSSSSSSDTLISSSSSSDTLLSSSSSSDTLDEQNLHIDSMNSEDVIRMNIAIVESYSSLSDTLTSSSSDTLLSSSPSSDTLDEQDLHIDLLNSEDVIRMNIAIVESSSLSDTLTFSSSDQVYNVKLFNKWIKVCSSESTITRRFLIDYIKKIYTVDIPVVIYCNGEVEFDCIHPSDSVVIDVCLPGGVRNKDPVHPGKDCDICSICKCKSLENRYSHLMFRHYDDAFVKAVRQRCPNIEDSSCFCRKCERKIKRAMEESEVDEDDYEVISVRKKTCYDCYVHDSFKGVNCSAEIIESHWDLDTVSNCFPGVGDVATMSKPSENIFLCRKHYDTVYKFVAGNKFKCLICAHKRHINFCDIVQRYNIDILKKYRTVLQAVSSIASLRFRSKVTVCDDSGFCKNCYTELKQALIEDENILVQPFLHNNVLSNISLGHTVSKVDSSAGDVEIEKAAFDFCVVHLADVFISKTAMLFRDLYNLYCKKLDDYGFSSCSEKSGQSPKMSVSTFKKKLETVFEYGLHYESDSNDSLDILLWLGHGKTVSLSNYISSLHSDLPVREVKNMSEEDILESALSILRDLFDIDSKRISDSTIDLRTINFMELIKNKASCLLWNFLYRLTMSKRSFSKVTKGTGVDKNSNNLWTEIILTDHLKSHTHFMTAFFIYSHCLYRYSNSTCNQPLPIILADLLDKYTKSSSSCLQLFNIFGISVSKDTLCRFQTSISENHIKNVPFIDISRNSFFYASLDNLDFANRHACVRANGLGRGLNCTTYMAGQPQNDDVDNTEKQSDPDSFQGECKKPTKRKLDEQDLHIDFLNSEDVIRMNIAIVESSHKDFHLSLKEQERYTSVTQDLFHYVLSKLSRNPSGSDKFLPVLKVFLSRKSDITAEKSSFSYIGILDETCDNKDTVYKVLRILYQKMEVGKTVKNLLVVGDGKTYDYLQKIKSQDPEYFSWMFPFIGDWHILKNYALALMKLYGPAGLNDLLSLLHKGRTQNLVSHASDFDKTFEFLLQTWEAMYRLEIEMFLEYHYSGDDASIMDKFNKQDFLKEVSQVVNVYFEMGKSQKEYMEAFQSLESKLEGLYDKFTAFVTVMREKSETFAFWYRYIHHDCMPYIALYLAGRSGDWFLRMYAIKRMMPIFHLVRSNFYYRLLPQHIQDLLSYPLDILHHLENGRFVNNLSGTPWSSVFLDETHEMTINQA